AMGDLKQKLTVEAKGEIAALADTINNMTDTLGTFAEQVSTVAREVGVEGKLGGQAKVPGALGTWRQLTDNVNQLAASLTTQIRAIAEVATAVTKGDLTRSISVEAAGEVAALKDNINQMIVNLRETTQKNMEQDWLKTNLARFSGMMQGQKNLDAVARLIMSELTPLVGAHHGAFFMMDPEANVPTLKLTSSYAYRERKHVATRFALGEGLIGQCALERKPILLTKVPGDYIQITSGLGESPPLNIIVLPVLFEGDVKAVIELASFHPFSAIHQIFLDQLMESIGVVLNMISANMRTEELLLQSQSLTQELRSQSKELQVQQEELKRTNTHLESQAQELEEKARLLEEQKTKVEEKNREVELARTSLEEKAEQLALISKYKSEFLANMSHELRTPLNSLLILAKILADNKDGALTAKQVEYAQTIYSSGGDLLSLINEILDLSKVEAGKMQVEPRDLVLTEIKESTERTFTAVATQKGLEFQTEVNRNAPIEIRTDPQRLHQVLKNLLANAFKFTEKGYVRLTIKAADRKTTKFENELLKSASRVIAFEVRDTGIGIAKDKQKLIFEAFQQADGTTSRKYGGTGLGLSISREIAKLLGGEIQLESQPGKGSSFTLYLPDVYRSPDQPLDEEQAPLADRRETPAPLPTVAIPPDTEAVRANLQSIRDDRDHIRAGDRVVLIIEDDATFARLLLDMAREKGFKGVVATRGDTGLALANELVPDAITLDIRLPIFDGWQLIQRLKRNPRTRHIPVHMITVTDRRQRGPQMHAFAYLEKPVSKEGLETAFMNIAAFLDRNVRRLLVVEDDENQRKAITELVSNGGDVDVVAVSNEKEALETLDKGPFDCVVVDLGLPDSDGYGLIEKIKQKPEYAELPIVVYTGRELGKREETRLRRYVESIIPKGVPHAPERLLDETSLLLHRPDSNIPDDQRKALGEVRGPEVELAGKKVLIVDDDVRNIFALTSVLEGQHMEVFYAENGKAGIEALGHHPDVDVVLMDVMMPEMDGYQTMRAIRQNPRFRTLPIIAITAKALKDDRDKCIEAGASDYLPKPVESDKLIQLIKLWLRD
ncbi:MAG: response regulator, partial [Polyangiales bacterium]